MTEGDARLSLELADAMNRFTDASRLLERSLSTSNASSRIIVHAGGVGVWVAVTCCLVMIAITAVGGMWLISHGQRVDQDIRSLRATDETHQAYINTLMQGAKQ